MAYGKRILAETLRSLAFGSIGASYTAIGTDPTFNAPIRILSIKNLTDKDILFSYNAVNDHEVLPAMGGLVLDLTSNKANESGAFFAENTIVYAKQGAGGAPTSGSVYVSAYYAKGD